jgi:hypothetical protein
MEQFPASLTLQGYRKYPSPPPEPTMKAVSRNPQKNQIT